MHAMSMVIGSCLRNLQNPTVSLGDLCLVTMVLALALVVDTILKATLSRRVLEAALIVSTDNMSFHTWRLVAGYCGRALKRGLARVACALDVVRRRILRRRCFGVLFFGLSSSKIR